MSKVNLVNRQKFNLKFEDANLLPKEFSVTTKDLIYKKDNVDLLGKYPSVSGEFVGELILGDADVFLYCNVEFFTRNNLYTELNAEKYNNAFNAVSSLNNPNEITLKETSLFATKVASIKVDENGAKRTMAIGAEIVPLSITVANADERILYWGNSNQSVPVAMTNAKNFSNALDISPFNIDNKSLLIGNFYSNEFIETFSNVIPHLVSSKKFGVYTANTKLHVSKNGQVTFDSCGKYYLKQNHALASIWKIENHNHNAIQGMVKSIDNKSSYPVKVNAGSVVFIVSNSCNLKHTFTYSFENQNQNYIMENVVNNIKFETDLKYNASNLEVAPSLVLHDVSYPSDTYVKDAIVVKEDNKAKLKLTFVMGAFTTPNTDINPHTVIKVKLNH